MLAHPYYLCINSINNFQFHFTIKTKICLNISARKSEIVDPRAKPVLLCGTKITPVYPDTFYEKKC